MALLLLQFFMLLLSCQANSDKKNALVVASNDFGLKLYEKFVETGIRNIIFSPLSISLALAMTSLGTRGQTLKDIRHSAFSGFPEEQIHEQLQQVMEDVTRNDANAQVSIANKLYARSKDFEIHSSFLESTKKFYGSEFQAIDFSNNNESASLINNWVCEKTKENVTEIVRPEDLSTLTRLVLVNAFYFKAQWASVFKEQLTKSQNFYITPKNSSEIEFLHDPASRCSYGVHETLHFEVLEKAFKSPEFVFGIILPDLAKTSLDQVEKGLTADALKSLELASVIANITIPSFKMESGFELSSILNKLEIRDLFSKKTDLSEIVHSKSFYVSMALHKAVFEIDENGVKAAAVSAVSISTNSDLKNPTRIIFRADHPFLFYIKRVETGSIVLLGKFSQS